MEVSDGSAAARALAKEAKLGSELISDSSWEAAPSGVGEAGGDVSWLERESASDNSESDGR